MPEALLESLGLEATASAGLSPAHGRLIVDPRPGARFAMADLPAGGGLGGS
jgi:hypothetical protein